MSGVSAQAPSGWADGAVGDTTAPDVRESSWPRRDIDRFVLRQLEDAGERPSATADRRTLARRLAFDLTGLPPTRAQVQRLVADPSDAAYEALVDELLASPHHAERMAMYWLDLVRFADTTGVHADNPWDIYPYRDWVIRAFADNMPFDQFTVEQLAGDLLPDATRSQKVAAAYNRLNLITREGGSQPKEFLARYMADRVRNVSTVWMAATVGCAECHDHKFDPIPTRDFYRLGAFFADIQQVGVYSQGAAKGRFFGPYLEVPTAAQEEELAALDAEIAAVDAVLDAETPALHAAQLAFPVFSHHTGRRSWQWSQSCMCGGVAKRPVQLLCVLGGGGVLSRAAGPASAEGVGPRVEVETRGHDMPSITMPGSSSDDWYGKGADIGLAKAAKEFV